MKIAIAAGGKDLDSMVSDLGGRAPYYLIFEDGELIDVIKNPFARGAGGAGFSVAYMLAEQKIDLVIAGKFGGNMEDALIEKKLKYQEARGTVFEAIKAL